MIQTKLNSDRPKDECGIFGVFNHKDSSKLTYFGLYALQHRGQESCGIVAIDSGKLHSMKGMGLVPEVFKMDELNNLTGDTAIGHVRYSTTGSSKLLNAQPFVVNHKNQSYAVAHNGNLVNAHILKAELEEKGAIFQTTMDSEIFLHIFLKYKQRMSTEEALIKTKKKLKGAYSCLFLTSEGDLIGMKDDNGFRPLCIGKLGDSYIISSETCALDLVEAKFIREIEPGEIVIINKNGVKSIKSRKKKNPSLCIFEYIYFARPDSTICGQNVYEMRKNHGKMLAKESFVDADIVMPFPDSGNYAAIGYAMESKIPFEFGMIRNHYVGRSFIQPTQDMRDFAVRIKLNPIKELLKGKDIIIIEDSIIRGTTAKTRVKALRKLGVKKVHMRVSCPPHKFPCYYGIDFSTKGELIAAKKSVKELQEFLELDSLHYLSVQGMLKSSGVKNPTKHFCKACFDGKYPVAFDENISKKCLE